MPQPLAGVIRSVAFAKQRSDSTAGPVGKLALMLLPAATLLAHIASDRRNEKDQRDRADALLRRLDTKFCAAIGVSADWGIICTWFLRLFDAASHDIAKSRSDIDCMIETLDACFLEGRVFQRLFNNAGSAATRRASSNLNPTAAPWHPQSTVDAAHDANPTAVLWHSPSTADDALSPNDL